MSDIRDLLNKLKQLTEAQDDVSAMEKLSPDDVSAIKRLAKADLLNTGISDNDSLNTPFAVTAENEKLQAELRSGVTARQLELYNNLSPIDISKADYVMKNIKLEAGEAVRQVPQDEKIKWVNEAITEAQFDEAAGEKDACYRKVKSRYKVWPSAYASGALTKCRKVGAANWGNKSKK